MENILRGEFLNYSLVLADIRHTLRLYEIYDGVGQHWNNVEEQDYIPVKKISNYIKKLIKEEARFMFSKTPSIKVMDKTGEPLQELQKTLDDVLVSNLFENKLIKGARDCFISKRIAIKVNTIDGEPRITFVPSTNFAYSTMENRPDKLKKIIFFEKTVWADSKNDERIWKQKYQMIDGKCYLTEEILNGNGATMEVIENNKDLGMDEIPCYIILNDGLSHDVFGESDVAELIDNGLMYNKMASEDLDTLKKGMNRIIYSTDVDEEASKHFKLKPGAYWDVATAKDAAEGKQATLGTLNTDFGYNERMENALSRIKTDMYEALNIPMISNEELKGMMTSGKSMKALYWQLITRCEEKFKAWKPALIWLSKFILISLNKNVDNVVIDVENKYPLQEDEDTIKQLDLQEVSAQVLSKKSYIMKWQKKKDEAAEEELKQIQLEQQLLEDSYTQFKVEEE